MKVLGFRYENIIKPTGYWKTMTTKLLETPNWFLSVEMCRDIYEAFKERINFNEPLPPFDAQIPNRLESILSSVSGSFGGIPFSPTVLEAATSYYYKIACGHVFMNGNKRLSILYTDFYLWAHDVTLAVPQNKMYLLTEELAALSEKGVEKKQVKQVAKKIIEDYSQDLQR